MGADQLAASVDRTRFFNTARESESETIWLSPIHISTKQHHHLRTVGWWRQSQEICSSSHCKEEWVCRDLLVGSMSEQIDILRKGILLFIAFL